MSHIHYSSETNCKFSSYLVPSYKDLVYAYNHPDERLEVLSKSSSQDVLFVVRYPSHAKRTPKHLSDIYNKTVNLGGRICQNDSVHARRQWLEGVRKLGFVVSVRITR